MQALKRKVSLADLAQQLQLSPSTVSRALAGQKDISQTTQARVRQLAEQLSYLPNGLAASLRRGRSRTLGLVVPHLNGGFYPAVVTSVERAASAAGYHVVMCQSHEDVCREQRSISTLLAAQVDGIILSVSTTTQAETHHLEQVRQQGTPMVFFNRVPDLPQTKAVVLDDFSGAYQAVTHLIEKGCERIAHLAGHQHLTPNRNRYLGYQQALRAHGLPAPPEWVYALAAPSLAEGRAGMRHLLALAPAPDAVFSVGAYPAAGALEVAQAAGLRVPHDLALACVSDEPFTSLQQLNLTTVNQRAEPMGEAAVRLLLQALEHGPGYHPPHVVLAPELCVRASSLRAARPEAAAGPAP